ncbi:lysophospholipid acyltransferase family protein [Melissospora conviva]|uniref:lysophospholipid acyltransferase family protein n=1 Tax=Melissospora conviva TaxID=3388432 RepID=UPI003B81F914
METTPPPWRPPRLWRGAQALARGIVALLSRLEITGDVPRDQPLILAANHISTFDPIVLAAACRARGISPRFLATGGLFRAPVVGPLMRRCGHIRVDRRDVSAADALTHATGALTGGAVVLVYPEGRIGLDPQMWPERGKTGTARLALAAGVTVVPVTQWGAHEVLPYAAPKGLGRAVARALWRRPVVRVHFGTPVDLDGLTPGAPGAALRATERITAALTRDLRPLRADEPDLPRHVDPTRPTETRRTWRPPSA